MMKKIRWGILSTANIGITKVIPGIQKSPNSQVTAIASRDLGRASNAADSLGISKTYGTYEAMLDDPDIDVIYNPLPNHLHVDFTLAAARAGKHVLCEKPIALNAADAEKLRNIPPDIKVMEAFMIRFHPQWLRARDIVASDELGDVRAVQGVFTYHNTDPQDVRNQQDIGGGGILDIGCYPITGARFLFGCEPKKVVALVDRCPEFGTDRQASVIADFGDGRQLSFMVSTQLVGHQSIEAIGTKARVEIVIPFNAPADQATAILVDDGADFSGDLSRREILNACDQYTQQATVFSDAILNNTPLPYGVDDAIASMRVLDAIFESEARGAWVTV